MKRSKKSKVSWSPGPKLFQVKMFNAEESPAKVASHYSKQSSGKRRAPELPPGFEGNNYADKLNVSIIPRIKWKQPPKFIVNDSWLVGSGGESTESQTENLRISKTLVATYPHRSAIPSRPSVSPVVEAEHFDDSKTPTIRLTPIEDEWESAKESSHTELESSFNTNKQDHLQTKLPSSIEELVSGLAPDLNLAASAALAALMKTKEQGSMVDLDLLIKFLSNPKIIKNLINDKTGKSSETENQPTVDTNINPTRVVPQRVSASSMDRKPQPIIIPREQSLVASQPFNNPEQRRVSPPEPGNANISPLNQINGNRLNIQMPVQSCVSIAKQPSLPPLPPSSSLPMNLNHRRPQHAFSEPKVIIVKPQPQFQPNSTFHTSEMNNVQASVGFGRSPQTGSGTYPMNLNRVDATGRARPVIQPTKSLDYFKNLIKEHGKDNLETNQYHSQTGIFNGRVDNNIKVQKQCIYFGSGRGCKMGERCIYVHDRFAPNFDAESPSAKRVKLKRYEKYGL